MGLAMLHQRVGAFSFAFEETFGSAAGAAQPDWYGRLMRRSMVVLTHEITHMFGLKHCSYWQCRMEVAGGRSGDILADLDEVAPDICPVDLRKLQKSVGFDIAERYQALAAVAREVQAMLRTKENGDVLASLFDADAAWYEARAESTRPPEATTASAATVPAQVAQPLELKRTVSGTLRVRTEQGWATAVTKDGETLIDVPGLTAEGCDDKPDIVRVCSGDRYSSDEEMDEEGDPGPNSTAASHTMRVVPSAKPRDAFEAKAHYQRRAATRGTAQVAPTQSSSSRQPMRGRQPAVVSMHFPHIKLG